MLTAVWLDVQAWVMITETDAQRVLAKVRAEVRAEEQQGGGREAAALSKYVSQRRRPGLHHHGR